MTCHNACPALSEGADLQGMPHMFPADLPQRDRVPALSPAPGRTTWRALYGNDIMAFELTAPRVRKALIATLEALGQRTEADRHRQMLGR